MPWDEMLDEIEAKVAATNPALNLLMGGNTANMVDWMRPDVEPNPALRQLFVALVMEHQVVPMRDLYAHYISLAAGSRELIF